VENQLRNPMNGVLGMTQLLEMTELTKEQRKCVTALNLSGKNLLFLINDILDLSKIEAGKITIEAVAFSLHQCINDVVVMQKQVIHEKRIKIDLYATPASASCLKPLNFMLRGRSHCSPLTTSPVGAFGRTARPRWSVVAKVEEAHKNMAHSNVAIRITSPVYT
jgi:signal transduction histidine kinase